MICEKKYGRPEKISGGIMTSKNTQHSTSKKYFIESEEARLNKYKQEKQKKIVAIAKVLTRKTVSGFKPFAINKIVFLNLKTL